ncbi:MAG: class II fructose-bisphosphate aldolase [Erysipelotrichaceae bacterium]|nr:class II fructose-bisphosphate aldolase [Erysipelotrichaceae bacterium]MBQ1534108.1 class II fructose-bisphosphate aldolase [Erysipelotrichaceae bacterium]MBQ1787711.1 class II fructose-bisphosphate aldolase [Erysipelotrichaceae bacterium]MBQ5804829.1 class II fructose-bisphosphate aldolase [Erysipelotrichaceae bacterium]
MLVNTKKMLEDFHNSPYALPSPDFFNLDTLKCHIEVAEELNMPLLLAFADSLQGYGLDMEEAAMLGRYYGEKAGVPVALHLDHGSCVEVCKKAADLGFTSVMIDASSEPFEENVRRTKEVVEYCRPLGITVEAEIGHVGQGSEFVDASKNDNVYTTVEECRKFVELTGVDSVAISIGTAHGAYKGTPVINFERLQEIRNAVDVPLVLHGGSSSGDENLKKCAELGISKINIFTDIVTRGYEIYKTSDAKSLMNLSVEAHNGMKEVLKHYYNLFGR